MNDTFQCGDPGALVAYLYDECEPGERELIATHITRCATCASEIETLGATRRTLAAWTPPDMALGFQITRAQDVGPAANQPAANQPTANQPTANQPTANQPTRVLEPKIAWWRAPMPAWAQAAAALVIFAAGLSLGVARNASSGQPASLDAGVPSSGSGVTAASVSREELAQLEQRIKAEMSQLRGSPASTAVPASARVSDDTVMQQVEALLEQSEERQRRDFTLRMVDLASNIETQRRVDLTSVSRSIVQQQGVVGTELRQQREAIDTFRNYLVTASERSR